MLLILIKKKRLVECGDSENQWNGEDQTDVLHALPIFFCGFFFQQLILVALQNVSERQNFV